MFELNCRLLKRRPFVRSVDNDNEDGVLDPISHPVSSPYLYFKIAADDDGNPDGVRKNHPNMSGRTPTSVSWNFSNREVLLVVSNGGNVASDLIRVDFQIRYCTFTEHKPHEGFTVEHANEEFGSTEQDVLRIDFVPALGSIVLVLPLADIAFCENLYVRARISTMFAPKIDPAHWDFTSDPAVVEAWTSP